MTQRRPLAEASGCPEPSPRRGLPALPILLAWLIIVTAATGARFSALGMSAEAGRRSSHSKFLHAVATDLVPASRGSDAVQAARHFGADDTLPGRHRKPMKRFRRRLALLAPGVVLRSEFLAAGTAGAFLGVTPDPPAPYRDHARAPPPSNQNA